MKILAIDCTAGPASAALLEDGKIISSCYTNIGLTHSQTLMPMTQNALKHAKLELKDIDFFAINAGPGSFTGVRIGAAALKGLTLFRGDCIVPVSTLESMAYNYVGVRDCAVVGAMDARRKQVYTGTFQVSGNSVTRLTEDDAIPIEKLGEDLAARNDDIVLVGDGAELCYNTLCPKLPGLVLAPPQLRYQNAVSVALCAAQKLENGFSPISSEKLLPVYLRAPQAERELKRRNQSETK
ncbi:MAG: tRNA (adenosine(37)-N6)-threonylcarbamoyltransferase complex dimerization subunit type 1 TsaB [Acutalibacteraceae bacterium]|nr:tRNA (adenosine(37)-N6)-threonylcarbamoyltransferase complex dimerization subunit type 1 TsaB [Acutalibacteraceae bacterium]